jgi:S-adenosylhomocysteine hydrolase
VHTVVTTPANESDVEQVDQLLHGKAKTVHADAGYTGAEQRVGRRKIEWKIARRRSQVKKITPEHARELVMLEEKREAQVLARVEHPFWALKCIFGYRRIRSDQLVHGSKAIAGDDVSGASANGMKSESGNYIERCRRFRPPGYANRAGIRSQRASAVTCSDLP